MNNPGLNIMSVYVFLPYLSGMQITSLLRRFILSSVACLAVPYFFALSHKQQDFRGKKFNIQCIFVFSATFI